MMLNKDAGSKELNTAQEKIQHIESAMLHREEFFTVRKIESIFFALFYMINTNRITFNDTAPLTKISNLAR